MLDSTDKFSQLECLRIVGEIPQFIIDNMDNMAATKLQKLDLHDLNGLTRSIPLIFANIIHRVAWIRVPFWIYDIYDLPPNIVDIIGRKFNIFHLAYAKSCVLDLCIIQSGGRKEFSKLTNLNIERSLMVDECEIIFHTLQYLKCSNVFLRGDVATNAPVLKTLHARNSNFYTQEDPSNSRVDWVYNTRFNAWPKYTLTVE